MRNPRTRILNTFNVCKVSTCSVSALVNCWFLKWGVGTKYGCDLLTHLCKKGDLT